MGWLNSRKDPLKTRQEKLNAELAALEEEIRQLQHPPTDSVKENQPHFRSTARPGFSEGANSGTSREADPVFESVAPFRARKKPPDPTTPGHYNDQGVRKFDIMASIRKWIEPFRTQVPPQGNLIHSIVTGEQGLRPTRYEKRVARNRFLYLFSLLLFIIWGIFYVYIRTQ